MQNLVNNLAEVVKGTMSVEEAFANMLDSIGKMLAQKGAEMIATYIAIGVARIFAGLGSSSTPDVKTSGLDFSSAFSAGTGYGVSSYPGRANGGPVAANTPYIVGEREPELFVPNTAGTVYNQDQMRSAMATYSEANGPGAYSNQPLNINVQTTSINGMEFITRTIPSGNGPTATQGAKQGEMRHEPSPPEPLHRNKLLMY